MNNVKTNIEIINLNLSIINISEISISDDKVSSQSNINYKVCALKNTEQSKLLI